MPSSDLLSVHPLAAPLSAIPSVIKDPFSPSYKHVSEWGMLVEFLYKVSRDIAHSPDWLYRICLTFLSLLEAASLQKEGESSLCSEYFVCKQFFYPSLLVALVDLYALASSSGIYAEGQAKHATAASLFTEGSEDLRATILDFFSAKVLLLFPASVSSMEQMLTFLSDTTQSSYASISFEHRVAIARAKCILNPQLSSSAELAQFVSTGGLNVLQSMAVVSAQDAFLAYQFIQNEMSVADGSIGEGFLTSLRAEPLLQHANVLGGSVTSLPPSLLGEADMLNMNRTEEGDMEESEEKDEEAS
jgi:hypothetical protein